MSCVRSVVEREAIVVGNSDWVPEHVDPQQANIARVVDALRGGKHNYAIDRDMARMMYTIDPRVRTMVLAIQTFLGRTVRYLIDVGIRQFIDIGSGIPTEDSAHEIAQRTAPDTQVVYVDNDPVAVAYSRALLQGSDRATIIQADLREPEQLLEHPRLANLIDLDQPVAVLVSILHFLTDDEDPRGILRRLRAAMAPGSYIVMLHGRNNENDPMAAASAETLFTRASAPLRLRGYDEILQLFDGFELVEPGLVHVPAWHPDPAVDEGDPEEVLVFGGVGRKS